MRTHRRAILIVTVAAVAVWAWGQRTPKETSTERAYRECEECGLSSPEVDSLIKTHRESRLNREQSLALFLWQFVGGRADAAECEPCAVAVLDAAGK